ncbi:MAG TPA: response regulator [Pirellulales bacterium]|nr:response regulator [Pirellulales bacterium]
MRVLLVDDDCDTTECMRLLLNHWGHDVHVANQGIAAIEQAPQLKPDLMLVDLAMPVVDGLAVARRVREMPELVTTALVALTGWTDAAHVQEAITAGFDECLTKPLTVNDLGEVLRRVRARIDETRRLARAAMEAAAAAREKTQKSRQELCDPVDYVRIGDPNATDGPCVSIRVQKSGIGDILVLEDRELANKLRQWLKDRGCRLGPLFEPSAGKIAFFTYSRRQTRTLLSSHPRFRIDS